MAIAIPTEIQEKIQACRDVKDDKFLELAVNGNADVVVTGDADLLVLNPFREIEIIKFFYLGVWGIRGLGNQ